ncbi:MAG TPA: hypothetical protein K8V11_13075 [Dietzia timorensis]|uniref:Uncharacterized protein n=1 Tax=Dietzia timorensis TaxID=499555 RepID=A0A921F5E4_9ACTN|nr:hypothetical protein [Dietzia timorensis]HJE91930.1 hypothetical protein [Dietzia timorensis]
MIVPRPSNHPNGAPFEGWDEPRRSRGPLIASIVLAVVIVIVVAAAIVWFVTDKRDSDSLADDPSFAVTTNEEAASNEQNTGAADGSTTMTESGNTTVTETVEPTTAPSGPMDGEGAGRSNYPLISGVPASAQVVPECDGRGVLIVQSVMGNSGDVAGEINAALANNPGAVVYPPGVCPSIRGESGGAQIYAVVQDFGDNFDALCSAEATAGGDTNALNARRLDRSTNWESPC